MSFTFCPNCGREGAFVEESPSKSVCQNCQEVYWNNPKSTASVVFLRDNQALFAKRAIEPNRGMYDFPGGFLEYNEDAYVAAIREMEEELGVTLKRQDLQLVNVYSGEYLPGTSVLDVIFVSTHIPESMAAADDVAAVEWKPLSFIESEQFVPNYPGLAELLTQLPVK